MAACNYHLCSEQQYCTQPWPALSRKLGEPLTLVSIDVKQPVNLLKKHPRLSNTILC